MTLRQATYPLSDCISLYGGGTPSKDKPEYWDGNIPWASVKDLKTNRLNYTQDTITALGLANSSSKIAKSGTIIIATRMAVGRVTITEFDVAINQDLKAIICSDNVDVKYLFYFLFSQENNFNKVASGATVKGIKINHILDIKIPLPPLAEQQKIAAILDAADSLRQKDRQLVDHYTTLSQSLFLEMFGDIFINPFNFTSNKLEHLLKSKKDMVDGPFGSSIDTKVDYCPDGEIPVIRTKNISIDNKFKTDDLKFMRREKYETVIRSQVIPGDIVLTKVGTIGNVCIMPDLYEEAVLSTTGSCRIRINEEIVNKKYFLHYLNFYKPRMQDIASAGVQAFLNMTHIKGFDIVCPPITLQNQFADRVKFIEAQTQQAEASLEKSEALFNSLLQRAFTGELTENLAA